MSKHDKLLIENKLFASEPIDCPWCGTSHEWGESCDYIEGVTEIPMPNDNDDTVEIVVSICKKCRHPIATSVTCEAGATIFIPDRFPL